MTTLSISSAFRHIAAAFGSERAQQKLAQQKEDRAFIRSLSYKPIDRDSMYPVPVFESGLPRRTRTTPQEMKNLLEPVSIQQPTKAYTRVAERSRDTLDRQPRSAPTHQTARVAASPSRGAASANRISADSGQQGGWLHNHWKPSAAGVVALGGHLDTPDAHKASAATATSAMATAREEGGNAGTFLGSAWMLHPALTTTPFRIPRPTLTGNAAGITTPSVPAGKLALPAKPDKALENKEVVQVAMRRQAPAIPAAPKLVVPGATHAGTPPVQQERPAKMIAQLVMAPAPPPPPPPPPLPPPPVIDLGPARGDAASAGVLAELKLHTFATSTSLDENATETFGTGARRIGDAAKRASLDAGGHGISPAEAKAKDEKQSLQAELALVLKKRREQQGEKRDEVTIAADRPAVIQPQRNAAARTDALIKPKSAVRGAQLISKKQQNRFVEELEAKLASRVPQRGM